MLLKDIPYLMIQGTRHISVVQSPDKIPREEEDRTKRRMRWQNVRMATSAMLTSKIYDEINEDKFIGWPIFWGIGGYNVEDMLNKLDPEQKELRISADDAHPNDEGHKIIAQEIYDAYAKIYI